MPKIMPVRLPDRRCDTSVAMHASAERTIVMHLAGFCMAVLCAAPSLAADASRGRALYENHCQQCHTPKIHSRAKPLPLTKNELRVIVDDWRRQSNLAWTPNENEDVVEYLNQSRYHFPAD